jgi:hypothetical protein
VTAAVVVAARIARRRHRIDDRLPGLRRVVSLGRSLPVAGRFVTGFIPLFVVHESLLEAGCWVFVAALPERLACFLKTRGVNIC